MGIGAALATGLVQGFTQNINNEKARRQGEQEKLDSYNAMIMKAATEGTTTKGNIELLSGMVRNAQGQLDDQERINLFGQQGSAVDVDFSGVLPLLSGAAEDKFELGGFKWNTEWTGDANTSRMWLPEVAGFFSDPKNIAELARKSPTEVSQLWQSVSMARRKLTEDSIDVQKGLTRAIDLTSDGELLPNIGPYDNFMEEYYAGRTPTNESGEVVPLDITAQVIPDQIAAWEASNPGSTVASVGMPIKRDGKLAYPVMVLPSEDLRIKHNELASKLGLKPQNNNALLYYWQSEFMRIPGDPDTLPAYTQNALESAIEYGSKMQFPETLKLSALKGNQVTTDYMFNILNDVTVDNGSDTMSKVYTVAAHLNPPKVPKPAAFFGDKVIVEGKTIQQYILKQVFGPKAETADFKSFMDNQTELGVAVEDLNRLQTEFLKFIENADRGADGKITAEAASMAYENFKKELKVVFDIDQGIVGGLLRDVSGIISLPGQSDADMAKNDTALTQEYIDKLQSGVTNQSDVRMARLEAMRISLAFRMARAADPSGRLSNQDIEIQLRKLGTNFSTIEQATGAISEAIREFTIKQKQYAVFAQYATDTNAATANDYKVVDAAILVDYIDRNANVPEAVAAVARDATEPFDATNYRRNSAGQIMDMTTGQVVTDQTTIDQFNQATGSI